MEVFVYCRHSEVCGVANLGMKQLPQTGTSALLQRLSGYIPDDLINSLFACQYGPGRRPRFSPAQLFRVHLLALITPVHSFNLLLAVLPEQRSWRSFARLRNQFCVPDVRMLHDFRTHLDLSKLRCINEYLLKPLLEQTARFPKTVALIDSTDLPAAANGYKKTPSVRTPHIELALVAAAAKMVTVDTTSDIRSTRCDYGFGSIVAPFCWRL